MILEGLVTGVFQENCYIVGTEATKEVLVVDPGDDEDEILAVLHQNSLTAKLIVCTHSHIDHIGAVEPMREATGAPFAMHTTDFERANAQLGMGRTMMGREVKPLRPPETRVEDGDELAVGGLTFRVILCPGHTPGHICLYLPPQDGVPGLLFTGDVLFSGSIGRFDLPGGDGRQLLTNIRDKLLVLPDETMVLPGHGPTTSIGQEKQTNPYIQAIDQILSGKVDLL